MDSLDDVRNPVHHGRPPPEPRPPCAHPRRIGLLGSIGAPNRTRTAVLPTLGLCGAGRGTRGGRGLSDPEDRSGESAVRTGTRPGDPWVLQPVPTPGDAGRYRVERPREALLRLSLPLLGLRPQRTARRGPPHGVRSGVRTGGPRTTSNPGRDVGRICLDVPRPFRAVAAGGPRHLLRSFRPLPARRPPPRSAEGVRGRSELEGRGREFLRVLPLRPRAPEPQPIDALSFGRQRRLVPSEGRPLPLRRRLHVVHP